MTNTRQLQIEVGSLGRDIIAQMTTRERDKFHGYFDQRQEYFGKIIILGEQFELGIARREEKATVLIKAADTGSNLVITEEKDYACVIIPKRVPETVVAALPGEPMSKVAGSFPNLPVLDQMIINSVDTSTNHLIIKADTNWEPYEADYVRKENW